MTNDNDEDAINRKRGRPNAANRKQVDFEEALTLQKLRTKEQISSLAAKNAHKKSKKKHHK